MELESLLFSALSSPLGIEVTTSDPSALRQKLYTLRKKDSIFLPLSFVIPPTAPSSTLWIVRKPDGPPETQ